MQGRLVQAATIVAAPIKVQYFFNWDILRVTLKVKWPLAAMGTTSDFCLEIQTAS